MRSLLIILITAVVIGAGAFGLSVAFGDSNPTSVSVPPCAQPLRNGPAVACIN